jgi:hypothetical protein
LSRIQVLVPKLGTVVQPCTLAQLCMKEMRDKEYHI